MKYQNYLLLGGAGFIGTNLALFLKEKGANVKIIDNLSNSFPDNVELLKKNNIELVTESVFDSHVLHKHFENQEVVINLTSTPVIEDGFKSSEELFFSQTVSSHMAIQMATGFDSVQKIVLLSSLHVYGNPIKYRSKLSETSKIEPINGIGCTHQCVENIANTFGKSYKKPVSIIRLGEVLGKNCNIFTEHRTLFSMILDPMAGYGPVIINDGEHSTDFISVNDTCRYIFKISNNIQNDLIETYNLCSGKNYKINQIVDFLLTYIGKKELINSISHDDLLRPYVFHIIGDNSKLINKFGDLFRDDFETSLKETIDFISSKYSYQLQMMGFQ